jgi:hypothetical protein
MAPAVTLAFSCLTGQSQARALGWLETSSAAAVAEAVFEVEYALCRLKIPERYIIS